jgi:hypothetical protein
MCMKLLVASGGRSSIFADSRRNPVFLACCSLAGVAGILTQNICGNPLPRMYHRLATIRLRPDQKHGTPLRQHGGTPYLQSMGPNAGLGRLAGWQAKPRIRVLRLGNTKRCCHPQHWRYFAVRKLSSGSYHTTQHMPRAQWIDCQQLAEDIL